MLNTLENYLQHSTGWLMTTGLKIALIIILTIILFKLTHTLSNRFSLILMRRDLDLESKKRAETLASVVRHLAQVILLLFASITIIGQLGIEIGPILAAAGIVGLAVGFGAQSLVKDVINGFFILLEDQIRVGDVVQIADKNGVVEKVNLKLTILRDVAGNVHYIPNGSINVVTNMTKDFSYYVFDFGVAYKENIENVMNVLKQVDAEIQQNPEFANDILEPIEILGLDKFAESALVIKARVKTNPGKQWRVGREYNRAIKLAFERHNIEIPYPQITMNMSKNFHSQQGYSAH
ncbi:MAG TPA: mechanosensitive ion channel family protein [bacterium]|nr:mechanosensitive ion channel family protein [bacterium]HPN46182.1 mechanosensitive ion channel family protein [bacterium]